MIKLIDQVGLCLALLYTKYVNENCVSERLSLLFIDQYSFVEFKWTIEAKHTGGR